MVYAGTETTTWLHKGRVGVYYAAAGIDADAEVSTGFDSWAASETYQAAAFIVERTGGATDLIGVKVEGSMDNSVWEDTDIVVTAKDTYDWHPTPDLGEPDTPRQMYRYWRVSCTTVGAGNTRTGKLWLYKKRR